MPRTLAALLLLLAASMPLGAQTPGTPPREIPRIDLGSILSTEAPPVADSLRRAIPGTRLRLAPPPGFTPAQRFSGFQDARTGASILVMEIPGPFAEVSAGFERGGLATQGVELVSLSPLRFEGHRGVLFMARQAAGGIRYEKLVLAFGRDSATVLITANYPETAAAKLREPMRRALLSASWSGPGPVDLHAELPFEVTETPELKRALRLSNALGFSESGEIPVRSPGEAFVVASVSLRPADLRDLDAYSRSRLLQTPYLKDVRFRPGAELRIGERTGWELVADAASTRDDVPLVVYQVLVPDGDGYTILHAQVAAARAARFLPQFRQMAQSLRHRKAR